MRIGRSHVVSCLTCLLAAFNVQPAQAGSSDWSGCHAGINAGYGWAYVSGIEFLRGTEIGSATARGVALGGQLGCDRQSGDLVWGAQLSADKSFMTGDHLYNLGSGPSDRVTYDIESLITITGRIGHVLQSDTLAYLKAGGAWTKTNHDDSDPAPTFGVPYTGNTAAIRNGWLLGLGLERKTGKNLSSYVEYNYMNFGSRTVTIAYSDGVVASYSFKQHMSFLGAGVNYRFE